MKKAWLKAELRLESAFLTDKCVPGLSDIEKYIKWERKEYRLNFHKRIGRSALHPSGLCDDSIKALKIKGAGALTHTGRLIHPTNIPLYNDNPHLGFTENGEFIPVRSDPSPIGAITIERAEQEFTVARVLLEHGCPSIVPLQIYKYTDANMRFIDRRGKSVPLGVVVSGVPNSSHLRGDSVFRYDELDESEKETLNSWITSIKNQHLEGFVFSEDHPYLSLISALSRLYGRTIRKFSEAGLYRYSGAPDNYSYSVEEKEVFLIDLDSSMSLNALSPIRQSLEIMRDAASGIAYLLAFFSAPMTRHNFSSEDIVRENPFKQLLIGYYADVYNEDPMYLEMLSQVIAQYYKKICDNAPGEIRNYQSHDASVYSSEIIDEEEQEAREFTDFLSRSYLRPWISRSETFSYLMPICWLLHGRSRAMMTLAPKILRKQKLFENIKAYNHQSPEVADLVSQEIQRALSTYR